MSPSSAVCVSLAECVVVALNGRSVEVERMYEGRRDMGEQGWDRPGLHCLGCTAQAPLHSWLRKPRHSLQTTTRSPHFHPAQGLQTLTARTVDMPDAHGDFHARRSC